MGETTPLEIMGKFQLTALAIRDALDPQKATHGTHQPAAILAVLDLLDRETRVPQRVEPAYRIASKIKAALQSGIGPPDAMTLAGALIEALTFCMPSASPHLEMVLVHQDDARREMENARADAENHRNHLEEKLQDALAGAIEKAEGAARAAQDAAQTAAANVHVTAFEKRSEAYRRSANVWLGWIAAGAVGWLAGATVSAYFANAHTPWPLLALRVVALSFGLAILGFFARAYSANRHNAVVNEHRATALQTMQAFISASSDESTKKRGDPSGDGWNVRDIANRLRGTRHHAAEHPSDRLAEGSERIPLARRSKKHRERCFGHVCLRRHGTSNVQHMKEPRREQY